MFLLILSCDLEMLLFLLQLVTPVFCAVRLDGSVRGNSGRLGCSSFAVSMWAPTDYKHPESKEGFCLKLLSLLGIVRLTVILTLNLATWGRRYDTLKADFLSPPVTQEAGIGHQSLVCSDYMVFLVNTIFSQEATSAHVALSGFTQLDLD